MDIRLYVVAEARREVGLNELRNEVCANQMHAWIGEVENGQSARD